MGAWLEVGRPRRAGAVRGHIEMSQEASAAGAGEQGRGAGGSGDETRALVGAAWWHLARHYTMYM